MSSSVPQSSGAVGGGGARKPASGPAPSAASLSASAELGPMLAAAMAQYASSTAAAHIREPGPPAQSPPPMATSLSASSPAARTPSAAPVGPHAFSKPLAQYPSVPSPSSASAASASKLSVSSAAASMQNVPSPSPRSRASGAPRHEASPRGAAHSHALVAAGTQQQQQQHGSSSAGAPSQQPAPAHAPLRSIHPPSLPLGSTHSLPPFLHAIYTSSRAELARYDALIHAKVRNELGAAKLRDVSIVVGIPFYTEVSNIHSVLVTMRDVFQRRRQKALFVIVGEFSRQDCVQDITDCSEIERGEPWETEGFVGIETMVKPHPRYASKPWTVRALQIIASQCGGPCPAAVAAAGAGGAESPLSPSGNSFSSMPRAGAHLLIMDADIQFNHWELSAQSLVSALLDPLQEWERLRDASRGLGSAAKQESPSSEHASCGGGASLPELPRAKSRAHPLYPSPMPLHLASSGGARRDPSEMDGQGQQSGSDENGAVVGADGGDGLSEDADEAVSGSKTTFSPVFPIRHPAAYPASTLVPSVPTVPPQPHAVKLPPPAAGMVVLNAPRSFFADDAIVHLVTYLHSMMSLGVEIHQAHGGEFSLHKDLNRALLKDESIVYDRAYCVEAQMAHRAAFVHPLTHRELFPSLASLSESEAAAILPQGCSLLEILMKGKWHAKITLGKLLAFEAEPAGAGGASGAVLHAASSVEEGAQHERNMAAAASAASAAASNSINPAAVNPSYPAPAPAGASGSANSRGSRARIDLVSEKLLNESLLWGAALGERSPHTHSPRPIIHHVGGPEYIPSPDPKAQSLRVLAPTSTRKQMVKMLKQYTQALLLEHVSSSSGNGGAPGLPVESRFVQRFIPMLQQQVCRRQASDAVPYIVSFARASQREEDPWHPSRISEKEREKYVVFGPEQWASYTVELLVLYRDASRPQQRRAVICAHRLVWLLGCVAFLNDHTHCLWGHMHSSMHQVYAPVFRRAYLTHFLRLPAQQVEDIMHREGQPSDVQHVTSGEEPNLTPEETNAGVDTAD